MSYEPGIAVIVCNYRTPRDLREFLRSFQEALPGCDWHLSVANVDPRPADEAAVTPLFDLGERFTSWASTDNCGYAVAVNAAAAGLEVPYDTLAVFNADVVLAPGALEECRDLLWSRPEWGILGPRQVDLAGTLTASGIFGPPNAPAHRAWLEKDNGQCSDLRDDCRYVSGSAMWIKRTVWDELTACPIYHSFCCSFGPEPEGALLPTKLMYEESAMCAHAAAHGYRNVYAGSVRIIHKYHQSVIANGIDPVRMMAEGREVFRGFCAAHGIACE